MHELSIVATLFETLEEKAREHRARKITRVRLKVGRLAGVVPEFLTTAFDAYKEGTIAAGAELEIEESPVTVRCRKCEVETAKNDFIFACPACGSTDIELTVGLELLLDSIELEC
jgi:hydrogenase nickel incorporation protein HypA/HybF